MLRKSLDLNSNKKKGNVALDSIVVVTIVFVLAFLSFFTWQIYDQFADSFLAEDDFSEESKELMQKNSSNFPGLMDGIIFMVLIFIWGITIFAAIKIKSSGGIFIFIILLLIFVTIIGMIFNNIFASMFEDPSLEVTSNFPITSFIMQNLLEITIFAGFTILISLFVR